MHFARDQEMEAEINMEQCVQSLNELFTHNIAFREMIDEKYPGKLEKHYDAPAFQVVSGVFRALSGKKIIGQT